MIVKNTESGVAKKLKLPENDVSFSFFDQRLIFEEGIKHIQITDYSNFRGDVVFPSTVTDIDVGSLKRSNLSRIIVSDKNEFFSDQDGILYSKDKSVLYCVPKNYAPAIIHIPPETKFISQKAFADCKCIIHVTFAGTVQIDKHAFHNSLISEVVFREDAYISKEAFFLCAKLHKVISRGKKFSVAKQAFSVCDSLSTIETEAGEFIIPLSDDFEIAIRDGKLV